MFKTGLAIIGGVVIVYKLCQGYAWYIKGKYQAQFDKKEEELRKQYGNQPTAA
jgi:hypothetical protein